MSVQNNTRPSNYAFNPQGPAEQGDVMTMLANIMHMLGNQRGDELRDLADGQKQLFEKRKQHSGLKQKLADMAAANYIAPTHLDAFEEEARALGFDTTTGVFAALRRHVGGGTQTFAGDRFTQEQIDRLNTRLDAVTDAMKSVAETIGDEQTVRNFEMQKGMQAFTSTHGEAKKVLEQMARLA